MKAVTKPKYNVGQIIDLSYRKCNDKLPDRIYISMIYMKDGSEQWMYKVMSEKGGLGAVSEDWITKRKSSKKSKCYKHSVVVSIYSRGFRFCGNYPDSDVKGITSSIKSAEYVKNIVLFDAIDRDGNILDGYKGIWVRYDINIGSDFIDDSCIIIK